MFARIIMGVLSSLQEHVWLLAITNVATVLVETVQAVLQTVFVTPSAVPVVIVVVTSETPALHHLGHAGLPALIPAVPVLDVLGNRRLDPFVFVMLPVEGLGIAVTTLTQPAQVR